MNRKIRKPVRRNVKGLREGVNTFKKRHLLREAPDDIEYSVEKADWYEECDTWEEAREKLRTLVTPEKYKQLMKFYEEDGQVIDIILYDILENYEFTPVLFTWVIENVHNECFYWLPADEEYPEEFFEDLHFSIEDFPEYFDYANWYDDFRNGYLNSSDTLGYEMYESTDGGDYAIKEDLLIRDVDNLLSSL